MTSACLVKYCINTIESKGITWYVAPVNNWKKIWEQKLEQTYRDGQVICSAHFPESSFLINETGLKALRSKAVPEKIPNPFIGTPILIPVDDANLPTEENKNPAGAKDTADDGDNDDEDISDNESDYSDSDEEFNDLLNKYTELQAKPSQTQIFPRVVDLSKVSGNYLICYVCGIYCSNDTTLRAHVADHPKRKPRKACVSCGDLYVGKCTRNHL